MLPQVVSSMTSLRSHTLTATKSNQIHDRGHGVTKKALHQIDLTREIEVKSNAEHSPHPPVIHIFTWDTSMWWL